MVSHNLLFYLGSTMHYKHLCVIFGITPSACSCILNNMLDMAVRQMCHHPLTQVKFTHVENMQQLVAMVELCEPSVNDVIRFMDSVSFTCKCTDERFDQNAFFWDLDWDTMVDNIFAYWPDGNTFFCAINFPGSWEDGLLTTRFLHHIKSQIGPY